MLPGGSEDCGRDEFDEFLVRRAMICSSSTTRCSGFSSSRMQTWAPSTMIMVAAGHAVHPRECGEHQHPRYAVAWFTGLSRVNYFAFSDVRRLIAQEALDVDFQLVCPLPRKPTENTFAAAFMRLAA